jgi:hypothetical protein
MTKPKKKNGKLYFSDHPEFTPNLTPKQMFKSGVFGGTYWRPIKSSITKKTHKNPHLEFPKSWWSGLDSDTQLTSDVCRKKINKYGEKSGTSLKYWEKKGWIKAQDPYGWVQWYCRFYQGRRTDDDERQIKRWLGVAGDKSRFRNRLILMCHKKKKKYNDITVSPVIRQLLLQWGYELTLKDFNLYLKSKGKK